MFTMDRARILDALTPRLIAEARTRLKTQPTFNVHITAWIQEVRDAGPVEFGPPMRERVVLTFNDGGRAISYSEGQWGGIPTVIPFGAYQHTTWHEPRGITPTQTVAA